MSFVSWKLEHSSFDPVTKSYSSPIVLDSYNTITVKKKVGDGRDSFEFNVDNYLKSFDNYFKPNDIIKISRSFNDGSEEVIMNGIIRSVPANVTSSRDDIKISGYDHSETLMNALVFIDATNLTVDEAIKQALNSVTLYNDNFKVTWKSSNPSVRYSDGQSFPIVGERIFYKSLNYILEKYSANDRTGDGIYYWYVNEDNELVWDKRQSVVSNSFSTNGVYKTLQSSVDNKDVKNFVIIKGGTDAKGNPLQNYYADYTSIAKNGFKYYIFSAETKTAQSILDAERSEQDVDDLRDASYPLTPIWDSTVTASSFDDYNDKFRVYMKSYLRSLGKVFVEQRKNGKFTLTLQTSPKTYDYALGQLIRCELPSVSSTVKNLRVEEITYTTTFDSFKLVEDIGTV